MAQRIQYKNLTLKKSLGQHYLTDELLCQKIADVILDHPYHHILEVGPGAGAITKYLIRDKQKKYLGIDADPEKIDFLKNEFPDTRFIKGDFLQYEIEEEVLLCGNYPYQISAPILFKLLENKDKIPAMAGMFQKEVAERVAALPNNKSYGILSVLIQVFYDTKILFDIHPKAFVPPPKVMSSFIELKRNDNPWKVYDVDSFKKLVKRAFNQRRKKLSNSLKDPARPIPEDYAHLRPEQLSPQDFTRLYHLLNS